MQQMVRSTYTRHQTKGWTRLLIQCLFFIFLHCRIMLKTSNYKRTPMELCGEKKKRLSTKSWPSSSRLEWFPNSPRGAENSLSPCWLRPIGVFTGQNLATQLMVSNILRRHKIPQMNSCLKNTYIETLNETMCPNLCMVLYSCMCVCEQEPAWLLF